MATYTRKQIANFIKRESIFQARIDNLFKLFWKTGDEEYLDIIDIVFKHLVTFPITDPQELKILEDELEFCDWYIIKVSDI